MLFTRVHAYIYSSGDTYWHISRLVIGYQLHLVDVLVVHIWILDYTCNILLLLTKQKLEFIHDVNKMVILKQMMTYINWLMELYSYMRMLG